MQPFHVDDLLSLVRDTKAYLARYSDPILAQTEDCEYFRKRFKKAKVYIKPPEIREVPLLPPPTPVPAPVIVKKMEPAPEPPPAPKPIPEAYRAQDGFVNLDSARQSIIDLHCEHHSQVEKGEQQDRLGKAAASPNSHNLTERGIKHIEPPAFSYQRWKTLFANIAPQFHVTPEIPNDALAKKIASRWKTKNQTAPITILCYQEIPEQKALLQEIAKALDVYFGPAKLVSAESIEKEKQWEAFLSVSDLKLIICCDYTLWQLPNLLQFYKEVPSQKARHIGDKPLFLLPDLSLYLKDPLLKRSLWKALCQISDPASP